VGRNCDVVTECGAFTTWPSTANFQQVSFIYCALVRVICGLTVHSVQIISHRLYQQQ
jgi:hypothetical protein